MARLFLLALRNLGRNLRRTLITLAAIGLGLALMVQMVVLQSGQHDSLRTTAIATMAGHVVVQGHDYAVDHEPTIVVDHAAAIADGLLAQFPGSTVTRRMWLDGLLTSANGSTGAAITCIDPVAEAAVQDVEERVVEGTWLDDDTRGIVIGRAMADSLGIGVGDKVVFMGQFGQDEMQSRLFRVKGIFRTGSAEMDAFTAWATLGAGEELLGKDDVAHQVALHLPGGANDEAAVADVRAVVDAAGPGADVLHYSAALPELFAMLDIDRQSNDVILFIFGVIVAMGVLNTVLMSVMERSREFGVLMAIGMRPGKLAGLVLAEALFLGLIGAAFGMILGCALSWPMVEHGLDYSAMLGDTYDTGGVTVSSLIKGRYEWDRLATYGFASVVFTVAAAAWPAITVARLTPLQAMHKV